MKRRGLLASLFGIILVAVLALAATLVAGRSPLLGLDLQGGVSVVLQPEGHVTSGSLQQAVEIIDNRVNGLGVANSTVQRQGSDVVIELPGSKNAAHDLNVLKTTARLFFRPVDCEVGAYVKPNSTTTTTTPKTSTTTPKTSTTTPKSATTTPKSATTTPKSATTTPATSKSAVGPSGGRAARLTSLVKAGSTTSTTAASATTGTGSATTVPATTVPSTTVPSTTTTTAPATSSTAKHPDQASALSKLCSSAAVQSVPNSQPSEKNYEYNTIIVPAAKSSGYGNNRFILGPADLSGSAIKTASAEVEQGTTNQYVVSMTLTSKGLTAFNKIAVVRNKYYSASSTSDEPYDSLEAFELDGQVEEAPTIQQAPFTGPVQISGNFTSSQASNLALVLKYGGLPVAFKTSNINTVSATLGRASLRAGLFAGLGGILLVLLYMIAYYRGLGLVVVLGLGVGGAILYAVLTELSYTSSLALTLPGITGIIVSVGITVDSYVVYFERLKDEVRKGQTIRSSVERGFTRAFKTVLTADLVSFLAALILYLFTVGDVRGFAFTLGLSTILDVFTAYFFIRPMVILLGRRRTTSETSFLGIARGLGAATPAQGST